MSLLAGSQRLRVIRVDSWDDLPEVLEPGVYIVKGKRIEVYEPMHRDNLRRIIRRLPRKGSFI